MQNKTVAKLSILGPSITVALVSLVKAYEKRSLSDALAAACIWLVFIPLFGLWWHRRIQGESEQKTLQRKLFFTILSSLIVALVIFGGAIYLHRVADTFLSLILWLILFPILAFWVYYRRLKELPHEEPGARPHQDHGAH